MQNASSAGRKLTNEERVEVVKRQKKRNSFQLAMLSVRDKKRECRNE